MASLALLTLLLLGGLFVAGAASVQAVRYQHALLQRSAELADVVAEAGRVEALVAQLADPRLNPAYRDGMRRELAAAAAAVDGTVAGWAAAQREATDDGRPAAADDRLVELGLAFAAAAGRAAQPGAALAPGQLTRGTVDGLYPQLRDAATAARADLDARSTVAAGRWQLLVTVVFGATAAVAVTLVSLLLGPVRRRLARQRADAERARQAAADSLARVGAALELLDVAVLVTDERGGRTRANAAARALFPGLSANGLPGPDVADLLRLALDGTAERLDWAGLPIHRALTGPGPVTAELARRPRGTDGPGTSDDAVRHFMVRARPLVDDGGGVLGVVTSLDDVTEVRARSAGLRRRVAQSTALSRSTAALLRAHDVRAAACDAALDLASASVAALFETKGAAVTCTAATDPALPGREVAPEVVAALLDGGTGGLWTSDGNGAVTEAVLALLATAERPAAAGAWVVVRVDGAATILLAVGRDEAGPVAERVASLPTLARDLSAALARDRVTRVLAGGSSADLLTGAVPEKVWLGELPRAVFVARATGAPLSLVLLAPRRPSSGAALEPGEDAEEAAQRMAIACHDVMGEGSLLGRYGAGFGVLLPRTALAVANERTERLLAAADPPRSWDAGVAEHHRTEDAQALRARVEVALWAAQRSSRGLQLAGNA